MCEIEKGDEGEEGVKIPKVQSAFEAFLHYALPLSWALSLHIGALFVCLSLSLSYALCVFRLDIKRVFDGRLRVAKE